MCNDMIRGFIALDVPCRKAYVIIGSALPVEVTHGLKLEIVHLLAL